MQVFVCTRENAMDQILDKKMYTLYRVLCKENAIQINANPNFPRPQATNDFADRYSPEPPGTLLLNNDTNGTYRTANITPPGCPTAAGDTAGRSAYRTPGKPSYYGGRDFVPATLVPTVPAAALLRRPSSAADSVEYAAISRCTSVSTYTNELEMEALERRRSLATPSPYDPAIERDFAQQQRHEQQLLQQQLAYRLQKSAAVGGGSGRTLGRQNSVATDRSHGTALSAHSSGEFGNIIVMHLDPLFQ